MIYIYLYLTLSTATTVMAAISGCALSAASIMFLASHSTVLAKPGERNTVEHYTIKRIKPWLKPGLIVFLIFLFLAIAIPSKKDVAIITGGEVMLGVTDGEK